MQVQEQVQEQVQVQVPVQVPVQMPVQMPVPMLLVLLVLPETVGRRWSRIVLGGPGGDGRRGPSCGGPCVLGIGRALPTG